MAQIVVKDPEKVAQVLGKSSNIGATYLALKLDTALWLRKNQTLLLRIRRPADDELSFICTFIGSHLPRAHGSERLREALASRNLTGRM
ncbi:MAG: hypothetical protein WKG07_35025 [Hymenobacter sp.]